MAKKRINWKRVWDKMEKWWYGLPHNDSNKTWLKQRAKVQQLVEAQLKKEVKRG